jgi:hypothetical protein
MTPTRHRRRRDGARNPPRRTPAPPRPRPCAHLEALLAAELAAGNGIAFREGVPSHKWGEMVMLTRPFLVAHVVAPPVAFRVRDDADGWGSEYRCAEHGSQVLCNGG